LIAKIKKPSGNINGKEEYINHNSPTILGQGHQRSWFIDSR
jgi:hypothetical protein